MIPLCLSFISLSAMKRETSWSWISVDDVTPACHSKENIWGLKKQVNYSKVGKINVFDQRFPLERTCTTHGSKCPRWMIGWNRAGWLTFVSCLQNLSREQAHKWNEALEEEIFVEFHKKVHVSMAQLKSHPESVSSRSCSLLFPLMPLLLSLLSISPSPLRWPCGRLFRRIWDLSMYQHWIEHRTQ